MDKARHTCGTAGLRTELIQHGRELCKYLWEQTGQRSATILSKTCCQKRLSSAKTNEKMLVSKVLWKEHRPCFLLSMVTKNLRYFNKHMMRKYTIRVLVRCPIKLSVLL